MTHLLAMLSVSVTTFVGLTKAEALARKVVALCR